MDNKFKETEIGRVPFDWKVSTLEEISLKVTDGSHFSPKESSEGIKIIATVKDMEYNQFSFKNCKRISDEDFDLLVKNGCSPEKGDILISKDGANCLDLIFVYNQEENIVILSSIAIVKLKKGFNSQFYRYYLLSPKVQKIMREGYVSGSAIPRVILKDFKKVPIPILPNIEMQNKIADILCSLDDKIALNRSMNSTLEAIGQALFKHWFVEFEFPDGEGKPYRSSGGEMVETELGEVPAGWRVGTLGDIADNSRQGVQPEDIEPYTPYIGLEHMPRKNIALADWDYAENIDSNKYLFRRGSILFGKLRPYFHKVGIAAVDGICSTDILVVVPKQSIWYGLVLFHISSVELVSHADATSTGTKMPRTNWDDIARFQIMLPPNDIAKKFTENILPLIQKIQDNILQSRTLAALRDALLPRLMSGQIRVPVEVNHE